MPDESYYRERGEERNWPKIILIILGIVILGIVVFLLIKGCGQKDITGNMERDLLEAGKEYYRIDDTLLPQATGECKTVTLGTLLEEELITAPENYGDCNQDKTYVKVCKLESGSYHYLPVMQCGSTLADDNFTDWKEGTEADLVADKSDVRFTFKGEKLEVSEKDLEGEKEAWLDELSGIDYKTISSTKYYRYRDLTWKWQTTTKQYYPGNGNDTKAYYAGAPANGYTNAEGKTTGWKWYTETTSKVWKKISNPVIKEAEPFEYACTDSSKSVIVRSKTKCEDRADAFTVNLGHTSTCDGKTALQKGESKICSITCTSGILNNDKTECGNMVDSTTKKYYPSGNSEASKENTYYVAAPVSGAKKDEGTSAQVSKYYKTTTTTSGYLATAPSSGATKIGDGVWGAWSSYQTTQPRAYANTRQIETRTKVKYQKITDTTNLDNWVAISDDYLSESDLISAFNDIGYEVNTLEDIETADDLRYQVKLEYRDRK